MNVDPFEQPDSETDRPGDEEIDPMDFACPADCPDCSHENRRASFWRTWDIELGLLVPVSDGGGYRKMRRRLGYGARPPRAVSVSRYWKGLLMDDGIKISFPGSVEEEDGGKPPF